MDAFIVFLLDFKISGNIGSDFYVYFGAGGDGQYM
jgi:hypothetical protein